MKLPNGIFLYSTSPESVTHASDLSVFAAPGFTDISQAPSPGGDVLLALFGTESELDAFTAGFRAGYNDDDVSFATFITEQHGVTTFIFLRVDADSPEDDLVIHDHRGDRVETYSAIVSGTTEAAQH